MIPEMLRKIGIYVCRNAYGDNIEYCVLVARQTGRRIVTAGCVLAGAMIGALVWGWI